MSLSRLNSLLSNLTNILRKEMKNEDTIHLYCIGNYWVAFEQSAYLLSRLSADIQTMAMQPIAHPFPVVMTTITESALQTIKRTLKTKTPDYKILTTTPLAQPSYTRWHRKECKYLMK